MSSYAITGSARGMGYEFVKQISSHSSNTVFALVRETKTATKLQQLADSRSNIHIVAGDITKPEQLITAAKQISKTTGGTLDILIHNATANDAGSAGLPPSAFRPEEPEKTREAFSLSMDTSVYGTLWLVNALLPLIEAGREKKIVLLSTGLADLDFINVTGISYVIPYTIAKFGTNVLAAKYAAELKEKNVKVLALSPGWVDTDKALPADGEFVPTAHDFLSLLSSITYLRLIHMLTRVSTAPPEYVAFFNQMLSQFQKAVPDVKGMIPVEDSVKMQLEVVDKLDMGMSGQFLSHHGDKNWL